jgi:hypothetical protein
MALRTSQIVGIAFGLALVGGVTIFVIHRATEPPPPALPKKRAPKGMMGKRAAIRRIGRYQPTLPPPQRPPVQQQAVPHPEHPGYYFAQPSQRQRAAPQVPAGYAEYAPVAPPSWTPDESRAQHPSAQAPSHVTYTPAPPMHATPEHKTVDTEISPTYWSDLVHSAGIKAPKDRLITVREAQHYLNVLGIAGEDGKPFAEDNDAGRNTRRALTVFQESHHLPMTGTIDRETSAALLYAVSQGAHS